MVAVPAGDLQRVGLDAYREIVVNDTALPHTFDGDGGLTRHFGEPDGVCYIVVGDAVPAVEVSVCGGMMVSSPVRSISARVC